MSGSSGGSLVGEQWWLFGWGAVVAHWLGSSGGSLAATPECKPAVPGLNLAISLAYSGLPILGWVPSGMVLHTRLFSEGCQRRINTKKGPLVHQKQ